MVSEDKGSWCGVLARGEHDDWRGYGSYYGNGCKMVLLTTNTIINSWRKSYEFKTCQTLIMTKHTSVFNLVNLDF